MIKNLISPVLTLALVLSTGFVLGGCTAKPGEPQSTDAVPQKTGLNGLVNEKDAVIMRIDNNLCLIDNESEALSIDSVAAAKYDPQVQSQKSFWGALVTLSAGNTSDHVLLEADELKALSSRFSVALVGARKQLEDKTAKTTAVRFYSESTKGLNFYFTIHGTNSNLALTCGNSNFEVAGKDAILKVASAFEKNLKEASNICDDALNTKPEPASKEK